MVGGGRLPLADDEARLEEPAEGRAELPGHGAVEDEVDRAVEEGEDVHELAEAVVAAAEEAVAEEGREQAQHALGDLGDEEEQEDGDQHAGRPVGAPLGPAWWHRRAVQGPQQPPPRLGSTWGQRHIHPFHSGCQAGRARPTPETTNS